MKDMYDLREKLETEGWVVSLHVSSISSEAGDVDIMAAKNGSVVFINILQLKGNSSTIDTTSERRKMSRIINKASDGVMPQGRHPRDGVNGYFAIWKKGENVWFADHYNTGRIRYKDDHEMLMEVLNTV
jgi:hypothetical protein